MPAINRPYRPERISLPSREAQVGGEADVLVVGGGPAGIGAGLGAAAEGARVIVAERFGFLGGWATAALVSPMASFHTSSTSPAAAEYDSGALFPKDHGPGRPIIGGVLSLLVRRLVNLQGALPPSSETGYTVPFDPEIFKKASLDLFDEAGVLYLLHAFASGVVRKGNRLEGVVFETKSGPVLFRAAVVVDCTGDGDVAFLSGVPFEIGREKDGAVQPMSLLFRVGGFNRPAFERYMRDNPGQWNGVSGLRDLVRMAAESGSFRAPREDLLFFDTVREGEILVNSTRVRGVSGTDVWDLTCAESEGRRQLMELMEFLRSQVPGFGRSFIDQSGFHIGVRESRRIKGEYRLTEEDILSARKFPDSIAQAAYPIDIHDPKGKGTTLKKIPPGESYQIPLRCLIPQGIDNLLIAGRCISSSHEALSSCRVIPVSTATGQASGVCAALAAKEEGSPRKIPASRVRSALVRQGAILD